jgi:nicotinamide-nucleotide adenylyltransferase
MTEVGVIHGRFQVLHKDHVRYLEAGKMRCDHLVVGITNPDPVLTKKDDADPHRSRSTANPLTYFERYTMLWVVLNEIGLAAGEFSIVPFPINRPELYGHYVPLNATFFLTIYDAWGRKKLKQFNDLGLAVHILWEKRPEEKGISGSDVRRRMVLGLPWEDLVPESVKRLMRDWSIPERLSKLDAAKG